MAPRPPPCSAYLQQVKQYQLRQWGCCYTGATGLTYEEALLSERRVEAVTSQVRWPPRTRALARV